MDLFIERKVFVFCENVNNEQCQYMSEHTGSLYLSRMRETSLNTYTHVSSRTRDVYFGLSLYLHTYVVYVCSEGSGDTAHLRRLA